MRRHRFNGWDSRVLMLDSANKKVGGVCAGAARYLDVSSFYVRLTAIAGLCLVPQATLIAYGLAYFILDDDGNRHQGYEDDDL